MKPVVLAIDDDRSLLEAWGRSLRRERFELALCTDLDEARSHLAAGGVTVILCDEHLPGASGSDFLAEVRATHPDVPRILITGAASMGVAVQAVNRGEIFRFLFKPCLREDLVAVIEEALGHKAMLDRCRAALQLLRLQGRLLDELRARCPRVVEDALRSSTVASIAAELDERTLADRVDVEIAKGSGTVAP